MHCRSSLYLIALSASALLASAYPAHLPHLVRAVDKLNEDATAEAQQRDDTATRAFSSVAIKTSSGQCLFVDELSGDFRANLIPVQVKDCDGSDGEKWDIITAGKHNDQDGKILVVSALTQGCLNFDPRRKAGDQVNLFSCGGRADGGGRVTNSQLFAFAGGAGPLSLEPTNEDNTCLTSAGARLDQTACNTSDDTQFFTFGAGGATGGGNGGGNGTSTTPEPPKSTRKPGRRPSCDAE